MVMETFTYELAVIVVTSQRAILEGVANFSFTKIFRSSLGLIRPCGFWGSFMLVKWLGHEIYHMLMLRMSGAVPLVSLYALVTWTGTVPFYVFN
jgi:hypothetical protein